MKSKEITVSNRLFFIHRYSLAHKISNSFKVHYLYAYEKLDTIHSIALHSITRYFAD